MTDTLWADISKYNPVVSDVYPYRWLSFRSNDGTLDDANFQQNLAWAKHACDLGKLDGFIVYVVFETNVAQTLATLIANVGVPHPKMAVMIDVESWGGRIKGDQTALIEQLRKGIVSWLGNNAKRCIVYGNVNDLNSLYPGKPAGVRVVVAAYGSNPNYPDKLAHQYADNFQVAGLGAVDINSADGYTSAQVAAALGLPYGAPVTKPYYTGHTNAIVAPAGQWILWLGDDGILYEHQDGKDFARGSLLDIQNLVTHAKTQGWIQ